MIIDLSKNNIVTNWGNVKSAVDGIILRVGYRGYGSGKITKDARFAEYVKACKTYSIPLGFYFMSQALTTAEAIEEADYCLSFAKEYNPVLGIFLDSEDADGTPTVRRADGLTKSVRTIVVEAFCKRVKDAGYKAGIYASESWFNNRLIYNQLKDYNIWVADYGKNTGVVCSSIELPKYEMHQYTSRGSVKGINGNVDMSIVHVVESIKPTKAANPYPVPTRTLKLCPLMMVGNDIKWVQYILDIKCDGWYGKDTKKAVFEFQKKAFPNESKEWDGICGKKTIEKLKQYSSTK